MCFITIPNDIKHIIFSYLTDNEVLSFQFINKASTDFVTEVFIARSDIKTPISSFSPIRSYFIRKKLKEIPIILGLDNEEFYSRVWLDDKEKAQSDQLKSISFRRYAELCEEHNCPFEIIMRFMVMMLNNPAKMRSEYDGDLQFTWDHQYNFFEDFIGRLKRIYGHNFNSAETQEVILWVLSYICKNVAVENKQILFTAVNRLKDLDKKEIAEYYVKILKIEIPEQFISTPLYSIDNQLDFKPIPADDIEEQYQYGVYLVRIGNVIEGEKYYRLVAERSHILAQYGLGIHYGRKWNREKTIKYYTMAADQDHIESQYSLGEFYEEERNIDEAKIYWKKAADQGFLPSQMKLVIWLSANDPEQKVYCKMAADQGFGNAQRFLANIYYGEKEFELAIKYLKLAISNDNTKLNDLRGAQNDLINIITNRVLDFNKNKIDLQSQERKDIEIAADWGHIESQWLFSVMLFEEGNIELAKIYWKLAADQGHKKARNNLGFVNNLPNLEKMANEGNVEVQYNLGMFYQRQKKKEQATKYFQMAIDLGHEKSIECLKLLY